MANHISLGKLGEKRAVSYLLQNGFTILHQNWRHARREIDIIATKAGVLHFIEVKTRRGISFGYPEEAVTGRKTAHLASVATEFQYKYPGWAQIQFDILSILLNPDGTEEYLFIEDIDV